MWAHPLLAHDRRQTASTERTSHASHARRGVAAVRDLARIALRSRSDIVTAPEYTFRLDEAEIARFGAMAANAARHEHQLWDRAGISPGATVVDLGCGPGALLPLLADRVGANGTVIGVDADPAACATARLVASDLTASARIVHADAADTGMPPGTADVVMCRNVLVHNGRRAEELLASASALLRPGGHLLSAEPDVDGLDFEDAPAEREYEQRWAAMVRHDGNDPALGRDDHLPRLLTRQGWRIVDALAWTDELLLDKSPAWAAAEAVMSRAFATRDEVARWRKAMELRRAAGPLRCSLTMTTVLSIPRLVGGDEHGIRDRSGGPQGRPTHEPRSELNESP
jgi:SAM-dependent methyltransferase